MSVTFRFEFGRVTHEESFTPEEWDLVRARTPDDWCGKLWSDLTSPLHDPEHTIPWPFEHFRLLREWLLHGRIPDDENEAACWLAEMRRWQLEPPGDWLWKFPDWALRSLRIGFVHFGHPKTNWLRGDFVDSFRRWGFVVKWRSDPVVLQYRFDRDGHMVQLDKIQSPTTFFSDVFPLLSIVMNSLTGNPVNILYPRNDISEPSTEVTEHSNRVVLHPASDGFAEMVSFHYRPLGRSISKKFHSQNTRYPHLMIFPSQNGFHLWYDLIDWHFVPAEFLSDGSQSRPERLWLITVPSAIVDISHPWFSIVVHRNKIQAHLFDGIRFFRTIDCAPLSIWHGCQAKSKSRFLVSSLENDEIYGLHIGWPSDASSTAPQNFQLVLVRATTSSLFDPACAEPFQVLCRWQIPFTLGFKVFNLRLTSSYVWITCEQLTMGELHSEYVAIFSRAASENRGVMDLTERFAQKCFPFLSTTEATPLSWLNPISDDLYCLQYRNVSVICKLPAFGD